MRERAEHGHWRGRLGHLTATGANLLVECTLSHLLDSSGAISGTLAVIRDVTVQAAAEAALSESRARLAFRAGVGAHRRVGPRTSAPACCARSAAP